MLDITHTYRASDDCPYTPGPYPPGDPKNPDTRYSIFDGGLSTRTCGGGLTYSHNYPGDSFPPGDPEDDTSTYKLGRPVGTGWVSARSSLQYTCN